MERLQKMIASSGYTSRRKAEQLITDGRVSVNGNIVTELGFKVSSKDKVMIDGVLLEKETRVYYLLNKPREVVCTTLDDKHRRIITSLIDTDLRIFPVGRLDYDTTGLIILTNDGEFANLMTSPKNRIEKVYIAKIDGMLLPSEMMALKKGGVIDGIKTRKARVKIKKYDKKTNTSIIELGITEGRNHQVKRMFEAFGSTVTYLKRTSMGAVELDESLEPGEFRRLFTDEVKLLGGEA